MPLPMVHFAVAIDLYAALNQEISPEFLLGSIAPDAIHLRDGWTQADKVITHFGLPYDYPDWAKIEPILARAVDAPSPFAALTAGYVAHVLTDQLWIDTVAIPNRDRIPAELSQDERRALYYRETDQIDFNTYRQAPWRPLVWDRLAAAQTADIDPLLTAHEIDRWRLRTLHWFTDPAKEPRITPVYYTDAQVADFVERAAVFVRDELKKRSLLELLSS
ncbi:MAG: hypothetical protein KDD84_01870 [Caldilineaceae bacterium]|nr:hypothetical protein [Caldilineaceae bacterium]